MMYNAPMAVVDPEILKGEGQKTMYQPCHHLSQMHTVNILCLLYGKRRLTNIFEANNGRDGDQNAAKSTLCYLSL